MTRIYLTVDYELYFGVNAGSVNETLVRPAEALADTAERLGIRLVFFVDAGMLARHKEFALRDEKVAADYRALADQLARLSKAGHEIQLHVHPHWEDCRHDGSTWRMITQRYRVHCFSDTEIAEIFARYRQALAELAPEPLYACRMGGWCVQPFEKLRDAYLANGIRVDSSVFPGGHDRSPTHYYDFRNAPRASSWRFTDDPMVPVPSGIFTELPVTSCPVGPAFYWRYALHKFVSRAEHRAMAPGQPLHPSRSAMLAKLMKRTTSVASLDGYKAAFLERAFDRCRRLPDARVFVVVCHPKALTPFSLSALESFAEGPAKGHDFVTLRESLA